MDPASFTDTSNIQITVSKPSNPLQVESFLPAVTPGGLRFRSFSLNPLPRHQRRSYLQTSSRKKFKRKRGRRTKASNMGSDGTLSRLDEDT